jgi:hypothetical protein
MYSIIDISMIFHGKNNNYRRSAAVKDGKHVIFCGRRSVYNNIGRKSDDAGKQTCNQNQDRPEKKEEKVQSI